MIIKKGINYLREYGLKDTLRLIVFKQEAMLKKPYFLYSFS